MASERHTLELSSKQAKQLVWSFITSIHCLKMWMSVIE